MSCAEQLEASLSVLMRGSAAGSRCERTGSEALLQQTVKDRNSEIKSDAAAS